jgi:transposase
VAEPDALNLEVIREHLVERLTKGEHEQLLADVLDLLEKLGRRTATLEFELMRLRKSTKGRKSEKLDQRQLQLLLSLVSEADRRPVDDADETTERFEGRLDGEFDGYTDDELEQAEQADDNEEIEETDADDGEPKPRATRGGRRRPPDHLPIETRVIEPDLSAHEGREMVCIGSVDAHKLDWRPGHFVHVVVERKKYAPRDGDGPVVIAAPPPEVIVRGLAEPGLLAHIIVSKYADHLPLHRQVKIFAREGVQVAVPSMVGWLRRCSDMLAPLVSLLGQEVLGAYLLQTDDTGIQVLDSNADDGTKHGHLWGYVGDRHLAYFEYTPNWKAEATQRFLATRVGPTQADAMRGYDWVFAHPGSKAIEIGCWAHARRYFVEAKDGGDPRAAVALEIIRRLYKIEQKGKERGVSPPHLAHVRKKVGKPEIDRLYAWIVEHRGSEPPSSPLGRAFTYAINQREALTRYLDDGRVPIDNTGAERALRGIAVGRHNWLFAGSDAGGERAAIFYSLIRTCELNDVEPWEYLRDVLMRLAEGWPEARLAELLPHRWTKLQDAE